MAHDRAHRPTGGPGEPPATGGAGPQNSLPNIRGGTYFLGRYRVVDEIGIGGMASVHLARMDGPGGFQKWVAIKRIHPHLVEDDTFVHMFLDEARVAARISHPNVATVFELGKHEDTYWIAMEYLHGEPLREVMRRTEELGQPMPPEIACRVIADAAEGLHAAHELLGKNGEKLGLVHRDVTPHNLFVTYDGNTKVVDFGIAKFSSRMASTRAGTLKGKLAYMSPEQVQGEQIDRRTDIFALGVVLWELTTGQRLFRMESDLDTLAKVQECNVPRPSTIVRGYPIDLEKIVMKALAKNKNERFRTARELSRALQSLLMRRGLFVASDEVASYTQSIFQDRIRKREAHLRWAAEVTQTINIEGHVQKQPAPDSWGRAEPSMVSMGSDVHASGPQTARGAVPPRPAAGAPPPTTDRPPGGSPRPPHSSPPTSNASPNTVTAASLPTNPRPGALPETVRPPQQKLPVMTASAAFVPAPAVTSSASASSSSGHPALDEANTIRASPQAMGIFVDAGDDFDDTDDTIVTTNRVEFAEGVPHFPTPVPAAGRPAPRVVSEGAHAYAPSRPVPPRASQPPPSLRPPPPPTRNTTPPPPPSISPGHAQQSPGYASNQSKSMSPATSPSMAPSNAASSSRGSAQPPYGSGQPATRSPFPPQQHPSAYGAASAAMRPADLGRLFDDIPAAPAASAPALTQGYADAYAPPPADPTVTQPPTRVSRAPLASEQKTHIAASRGKTTPTWMLAAAAAFLGLMVVGLVFAVVARTAASKNPAPSGSALAPLPSKPNGPFSAARAAFSAATGHASGPKTGLPAGSMPQPQQPTSAAPSPPPQAPQAPAASNPPVILPSTEPIAAPKPPAQKAAPSPPSRSPPAASPPQKEPAQKDPAPQPAPPKKSTGTTAPDTSGDQGFLSVICLPACDQVLDNGKPMGPSPIFKRSVAVGEHRLKLIRLDPAVTKTVSAIVTASSEPSVVRQSMTP